MALRRAEEALARRTTEQSDPDPLDPALCAAASRVGRRLTEIWADPVVSREHRKALLRCLVAKVVLRRTARDRAAVRIVWRGGATTDLEVALPVNRVTALTGYPAMAGRVRELATAGRSDREIARILTAEGHRSPSRAGGVLPSTVRRIRRGVLRLASRARSSRWDAIPGWLSIPEVAHRLEVSPNWVRACIRHGTIRLDRDPATGRHLFPDTEQTLTVLRRLRAHQVVSADFRQDHPNEEGHHYA